MEGFFVFVTPSRFIFRLNKPRRCGSLIFIFTPNSQLMEATTAKLNAHLLNRQLTGIRFFNVHDSYFVFDRESTWVFDSGVQLQFGDDLFSFGWNHEYEAFDYSLEQPMEQLQAHDQLYVVAPEETQPLEHLIGATITGIDYEWDFFQEYDEDFQLKEEKIYIPVGLKITFDNDRKLQLAAICYTLHPETGELHLPYYSLEGALLVAFDKEFEIEVQ